MENALYAKNKVGFVDGTLEKPSEASSDYRDWMQCNAMVVAWLTNSMSKELYETVAYAATARDIWVDLEEHFS